MSTYKSRAKSAVNASSRRESLPAELSRVNLNAAGVDVGASSHFVAVPEGEGRCPQPVREFASFTADLYRLADWLAECGVETVAMESTGVYWIPLFGVLEERGFRVMLVDPRRIKNVPGRKSDVLDCQWLQQLHTYGLLSAAFRPEADIRRLRSYLRQRAMLVEYAAQHVQHMQKALTQMNVKLHQVISDITGKTGMTIVEAIVAGERDPRKLAQLHDPRTKADEAAIARSLEGHWREEHIFELTQALELYRVYQSKIAECDRRVEPRVRTVAPSLQDQVVQVVLGFLYEAPEDLFTQPSVVFQSQILGMGDVEHCSPHKSPFVRGGIGQILHDVVVVAEINSAFFFDTHPCQHPRNVLLMIF